MALAITTICDSISQLEVSGVKIRDLDQIPTAVNERDCPVFYPDPLNFVSGWELERDSQGSNSSPAAKYTVRYTLTYTFLYSPVGADRNMGLTKYGQMVDKLFEILDTILANDYIAGLVDLQPEAVDEFGPVPDPAGNSFIGCRVRLRVEEFVN
jgi:hypothetical protein